MAGSSNEYRIITRCSSGCGLTVLSGDSANLEETARNLFMEEVLSGRWQLVELVRTIPGLSQTTAQWLAELDEDAGPSFPHQVPVEDPPFE